uniref:hypothetical protein n=1 Tax=Pulvinaster venetus TaxID=427767 RepID=UPI001FCD05A5|nr:hypothetical protein MW436_mgp19 [Pulvinaster venetus]UNJ18963.1 hypothetical protein [Pulvinaster venetus]
MLKKEYPRGFRSGLFQSYNTNLVCSGIINEKFVVFLYKKYKLNRYLKRFIELKNVVFGWFNCEIKNNVIIIRCYYAIIKYKGSIKVISRFDEKDMLILCQYFKKSFDYLPFRFEFTLVHWFMHPSFLVHWICLILKDDIRNMSKIKASLIKTVRKCSNLVSCYRLCSPEGLSFRLVSINVTISHKLIKSFKPRKYLRKGISLPKKSLTSLCDYAFGCFKETISKMWGIHVFYNYQPDQILTILKLP